MFRCGGKATCSERSPSYTVFCFVMAVFVVGRFSSAVMVLTFPHADHSRAKRSGRVHGGPRHADEGLAGCVALIATLWWKQPGSRATRSSWTRRSSRRWPPAGSLVPDRGGERPRFVPVPARPAAWASRPSTPARCSPGAGLRRSTFRRCSSASQARLAPESGFVLAASLFPLQAVALLLVVVQFWRSGMVSGMRYAAPRAAATLVTLEGSSRPST